MTSEVPYIVTPWEVKGVINYDKLIHKFGCAKIDGALIKRIHKLTRYPVHTWLRRGLFFSHRDLNSLLDAYERKEQIYIYTGRGPSNKMHLGHCIPFEFTKYLQDAFGAIVIIQLSDDEKYYFKKEKTSLKYFQDLAHENAKDIIAIGFNPAKTYIFQNSLEISRNPGLIHNFVLMAGSTSGSSIEATFGLSTTNTMSKSNTVGQIVWPIFQSVPAFSSSFPKIFGSDTKPRYCLVPMAIDQDPYFRITRDFAPSVKYLKPCCIHSEFLVGLGGMDQKMSSTSDQPTIFLTDTPKEIEKKVKSHAFSGGGDTLELHREHGGNLTVDVAYQYLIYFLDDDVQLEAIAKEYSSGRMTTGEIKKIAIQHIVSYIQKLQLTKSTLTDADIDYFFNDDREFDNSVPIREPIVLLSDEEYNKMGLGFDRYFGLLKSSPV
jgi:tryptophanyl-tRNA synthetase